MTTHGDALTAVAEQYREYQELTEISSVAEVAALLGGQPDDTWLGAPAVGLVVTA